MTSFYQQRLSTMGVQPNQNLLKTNDFPDGLPLFAADEEDNIRINYYDLRGYPYKYRKAGNKWGVDYYRKRLKHPVGDFKYWQPKKSQSFPYFTPSVIDQFINRRPIDTLFFTEGEFKAFTAHLAGLPTIGFPSIHGSYDVQVERHFHEDVEKVIRECQVQNLVFITDADTLVCNLDTKDVGKDLQKRAISFFSAIRNFHDAAVVARDGKSSNLRSIYWCCLRPYLNRDTKGIDDLLLAYPAKQNQIIHELRSQEFEEFFQGTKLSETGLKRIKKQLGATSVEDYYAAYAEQILEQVFTYGRCRYQLIGDELKRLRHEDASKYMRVGPTWYKEVTNYRADGTFDTEITPWKKSEIAQDYKDFKDFIEQIPRYDAFCNVPSVNGKYRKEVGNNLNVFAPITHVLQEGNISHSLQFLAHLFDNSGNVRTYHYCDIATHKEHTYSVCCPVEGDQFTIALDWLSLVVQRPLQKLPVPCLVSKKEGTGKTTFLRWLKEMFQSNAVILNNDRFKMNFNSHYATKYIIGIDEGFLEVEKKSEKEKLKQMVTSPTIFLESKGANVQEVEFHGKLIFCSNDADRLMKIDDEDSRWFIVEVPQFTKEVPQLLELLKTEVPAMLHFLNYRDITHPHISRLWFSKECIETEQQRKIVQATKTRTELAIENLLEDMFLTYKITPLYIHTEWLLEKLNKEVKFRIERKDLNDVLKSKRGMEVFPTMRIKIPLSFDDNNSNGSEVEDLRILYYNKLCRPYCFEAEDWLNEDDLKEFYGEKQKEVKGSNPDKVPKVPF